jgi:hypothetical protein
VAKNDEEVVAECMGQDESGHMITRFLVVDKCWLGGSFLRVGHRFLPKALDKESYLPRGCLGNDVPFPHSSFPFPELSNNSGVSVSPSNTSHISDNPSTYQSLGFSRFFSLYLCY